ncbi:MAG: toxin-antitoxin system HicB family antitoxin [Planctomycetes bacterium]|nr:toxin-antitoxin system HicB family antitoxin [Planctomycetota bacterium]
MSILSVRLPESLHQRARELARKEHVSINQLLASALGEKIAALEAAEYLEAKAARGSLAKFRKVLAKVPDVEPDENDRLD